VFGEIGLSGEIRAVSQTDVRLKEAAKLGFDKSLMPTRRGKKGGEHTIRQIELAHLEDLLPMFQETRSPGRGRD